MILLDNFNSIQNYIDKKIIISGFIQNIRNLKNFVFIVIRRNHELIQCILKNTELLNNKHLTIESTIKITGYLKLRNQKNINNYQKLGKYEIEIIDIDIIKLSLPLPFSIHNAKDVSLEIRERYRFLDLRNSEVLNTLKTRIKAIKITREFFDNLEFLEINTPILTCISQDGANNYIVKSRRFDNKYYALTQSPQLYKQIIMCSDIEKYYQIAPCFRDEESRSNRLCTEFTQIDMEMKISDIDDIIKIIISYIKCLIQKLKGSILKIYKFDYLEVINKYTTDQIDIRVWNKFNIKKHENHLSLNNLDNIYKELKNTFSDIRIINNDEIIIDTNSDQKNSLLMHLSNLYNQKYNTNNEHCIIVIYNYPFYEIDNYGNQTFKHNPFSKTFIKNNNVYAYQYDIIMDAQEIAGGSIREADINKLKKYINDSNIVNFIDMYNYGYIEHGGFALGLERFLSVLFNKPIENFIPFFTMKNGSTNLISAPNKLT
ncbi:aspartyl-tRNA synthetase [uncultured bacterium]|nr:aspartyl-tRNA synthetase [uncultured bacterium]